MPESSCAGNTRFRIGAGIYDITGPAAEREMIGYVMMTPPQETAGIHMRLRARAFVIHSPCNDKRFAFVSCDLGMIFQAVKLAVVESMKTRCDGLYTTENILLSATHTHSGPGGYSTYALYNVISLGFDQVYFDAIVDGICEAISKAHANLQDGTIRISEGQLQGVTKNRSIEAFRENPEAHVTPAPAETDNLMTLVRLTQDDGTEVGTINWFAVHGTSLGNTNHLISGDNKGLASYLFEAGRGTDYRAGKTFVAAFAQSNEGDVSPNVYPKQDGTMDDGRGDDEFASLHTSAQSQYEKALELYEGATEELAGGVDYRYSHVDYSDTAVATEWTGQTGVVHTSRSALGLSKFAGTPDGLGVPFLRQGLRRQDLSKLSQFALQLWLAIVVKLWTMISLVPTHKHRRRLARRTAWFANQDEGQAEKPIALNTGELNGGEDHHHPVPWTPEVLPLQIVTIGQLAIVAVPFECTTVAGRRLRRTVGDVLQAAGVSKVVIAGLANAYGGYCTTREEFSHQAYEGASTEFGPWQLAATQQKLHALANLLVTGANEDPAAPTPRSTTGANFTLQPGVWLDLPWRHFGAVHQQPSARYPATQTVKVAFWGGHPSNGLWIQSTFLKVQRKDGDNWVTVARDWDPETRFKWQRWMFITPLSESRVEWTIPEGTQPGTYRILHQGFAKRWRGGMKQYTGVSRSFEVA